MSFFLELNALDSRADTSSTILRAEFANRASIWLAMLGHPEDYWGLKVNPEVCSGLIA
jgi:hypothetical protein